IATAVSGVVGSTTTGKIQSQDIMLLYNGLNAVYRKQPLASFLMNDATYQRLRLAADSSLRPLINVFEGSPVLMGRPIKICPSIAGDLTTTNATLFFGDLSHFSVR